MWLYGQKLNNEGLIPLPQSISRMRSCILNHIDRLHGLLNGHDDAPRIQDGVVMGSFKHPCPGVATIIRNVNIWGHY